MSSPGSGNEDRKVYYKHVITRDSYRTFGFLLFGSLYTHTITDRRIINGEKVEEVRSITEREYEVC